MRLDVAALTRLERRCCECEFDFASVPPVACIEGDRWSNDDECIDGDAELSSPPPTMPLIVARLLDDDEAFGNL